MTTDAVAAAAEVPVMETTPTAESAEDRPARWILDVRGFSVDYGYGDQAVRAVDRVDLHLDRSTVLGVAGESGSGKSTLVYGLTRLLRAPGVITAGQALFNRGDDEHPDVIDLTTADEKELRSVRWSEISVVLQSALNALNPVVRVGSVFDEILSTHRRTLNKSQRRARAVELLTLVGLNEDRLMRYPHELSGGQRQRIMIALALALEPKLIIMDEPTTALDVVTQREIISELFTLRAHFGFAMIFITHDLSLLVQLADEIVVMYAGRLVERASARALFSAPRHPYTLGLLNSFPPMHGAHAELNGIPGSPPDLSQPPSGCSFHPRCPYAMPRCSIDVPELRGLDEGSRSVACWLHSEGGVAAPVELSRRVGADRASTDQSGSVRP